MQASPRHREARAWLLRHRSNPSGLGLFSVLVSGFLRVVTDRGVFSEPLDPVDAVAFVDRLSASPTVILLEPGPGHWQRFREMVLAYRPASVDMTDVDLAAAALEAKATRVSFDRGFARFNKPRWINPADGCV